MNTAFIQWGFFGLIGLTPLSCGQTNAGPSEEIINDMALKGGEVISCGPSEKQFGSVEFGVSCSDKVKEDFQLAIKLLHSFEYDEAEKVFARVIHKEPECAMAYWGVAMSNFHPLWAPPSDAELKKGAKAIEIAQAINTKSKKEEDYINVISAFYKDWDKVDHRTRTLKFENAMKELYMAYPNDKEAAIFYALALDAAADPGDKTYKNQKKAGAILNALYSREPNHPGVVHYIIHTYDSPELAEMGLAAARKYASVAPSSAHALHMPSHIFTRLGLWSECIESNLASASSAKCYAQSAGIKGHWDEELHALDYLIYAYLQKGENDRAREQLDYLKTIKEVSPVNFKVAYAFASIPSRYLLENKLWKEAANLKSHVVDFAWNNYPWQKAIIHFARLLGSVHIGDMNSAKDELKELNLGYNELMKQEDAYKANQVQIQIKTSEAWMRWKEGKTEEALKLMNLAADMEDQTEKHPVTPGEVIPARELLGDMLMEMNRPAKALETYEADLKKHRNRFNGLYGAGLAAEKSGDNAKARRYYGQLFTIIDPASCDRPEVVTVKQFLDKQ